MSSDQRALLPTPEWRANWKRKPASPAQLEALHRCGINAQADLSRAAARQLLRDARARAPEKHTEPSCPTESTPVATA